MIRQGRRLPARWRDVRHGMRPPSARFEVGAATRLQLRRAVLLAAKAAVSTPRRATRDPLLMSYNGPSLFEWLTEYRSRRPPTEVALFEARLQQSMDVTSHSVVSLRIARYDDPDNPNPDRGFYLFTVTEYHGRGVRQLVLAGKRARPCALSSRRAI